MQMDHETSSRIKIHFDFFFPFLHRITSSVAVILFIAGAKLSTQKEVAMDVNGVFYCGTIRPGIFSGAGIMGLVGVLLSIVYYLFYVSALSGSVKTSTVELEAPPITDVKKPPVVSRKH